MGNGMGVGVVIIHHSSKSASVRLAAPSVPVLPGAGKSEGTPAGETAGTGPVLGRASPLDPTRLPGYPQPRAHLLQDLLALKVRCLLVQILLLGRSC